MPEFSGANCCAGWVAVSGEKGIDPMVGLECLPRGRSGAVGSLCIPGPKEEEFVVNTRGGKHKNLGAKRWWIGGKFLKLLGC